MLKLYRLLEKNNHLIYYTCYSGKNKCRKCKFRFKCVTSDNQAVTISEAVFDKYFYTMSPYSSIIINVYPKC